MYDLDKQSEFKDGADLESFGTDESQKVPDHDRILCSPDCYCIRRRKAGLGYEETAAMFLGLALVAGVIAGFNPSKISKDFLDGCKKMLGAALSSVWPQPLERL